jgi:hypothetical protein
MPTMTIRLARLLMEDNCYQRTFRLRVMDKDQALRFKEAFETLGCKVQSLEDEGALVVECPAN